MGDKKETKDKSNIQNIQIVTNLIKLFEKVDKEYDKRKDVDNK